MSRKNKRIFGSKREEYGRIVTEETYEFENGNFKCKTYIGFNEDSLYNGIDAINQSMKTQMLGRILGLDTENTPHDLEDKGRRDRLRINGSWELNEGIREDDYKRLYNLCMQSEPGYNFDGVNRILYKKQPHLLQVATSDVCLIVMLPFFRVMPQALSDLLADPTVCFIGKNVFDDSDKLWRGHNLEVRNKTDLGTFSRIGCYGSLKKICDHWKVPIGVPGSRCNHSVYGWSDSALTDKQLEYGSNDATGPVRVLEAMVNSKVTTIEKCREECNLVPERASEISPQYEPILRIYDKEWPTKMDCLLAIENKKREMVREKYSVEMEKFPKPNRPKKIKTTKEQEFQVSNTKQLPVSSLKSPSKLPEHNLHLPLTKSSDYAKLGWSGDGSKTALSETDGRLDTADKPPPAKKQRDLSPPMPRKLVESSQRNMKLNEMRQCGDGTELTIVRSKNKTPAVSVSVTSDLCWDGDKELVKKVESKGTILNVFHSYGFIESKQMDTNVFFAARHVRCMLGKSKVPALDTMFKFGDAVTFSAKPQIEKSGCRWISEWVVKQNKLPTYALQVIDPKPSPKKVEPTVVPPIINNEPVLAVVEQVNVLVTNTNHGLTQSSSSMQSYNSYGQGDRASTLDSQAVAELQNDSVFNALDVDETTGDTGSLLDSATNDDIFADSDLEVVADVQSCDALKAVTMKPSELSQFGTTVEEKEPSSFEERTNSGDTIIESATPEAVNSSTENVRKKQKGATMSSSDENGDDKECPLCMHALALDDLNFYPCNCQYQICVFCWHRIQTQEDRSCPACRQKYPVDPVYFKPLSAEDLFKIRNEKKLKVKKEKQKVSECRKHLANLKVLQNNLVYVVGLSPRLADPETLKKPDYFGRFGKIHKVVVVTPNNNNCTSQTPINDGRAYVTYYRCEDALKAITNVNNVQVDGRALKVCLGTTKYCSAFLRNQTCHKQECMYLHEVADDEASFTKEDMHLSKHTDYERKLLERYCLVPSCAVEAFQVGSSESADSQTAGKDNNNEDEWHKARLATRQRTYNNTNAPTKSRSVERAEPEGSAAAQTAQLSHSQSLVSDGPHYLTTSSSSNCQDDDIFADSDLEVAVDVQSCDALKAVTMKPSELSQFGTTVEEKEPSLDYAEYHDLVTNSGQMCDTNDISFEERTSSGDTIIESTPEAVNISPDSHYALVSILQQLHKREMESENIDTLPPCSTEDLPVTSSEISRHVPVRESHENRYDKCVQMEIKPEISNKVRSPKRKYVRQGSNNDNDGIYMYQRKGAPVGSNVFKVDPIFQSHHQHRFVQYPSGPECPNIKMHTGIEKSIDAWHYVYMSHIPTEYRSFAHIRRWLKDHALLYGEYFCEESAIFYLNKSNDCFIRIPALTENWRDALIQYKEAKPHIGQRHLRLLPMNPGFFKQQNAVLYNWAVVGASESHAICAQIKAFWVKISRTYYKCKASDILNALGFQDIPGITLFNVPHPTTNGNSSTWICKLPCFVLAKMALAANGQVNHGQTWSVSIKTTQDEDITREQGELLAAHIESQEKKLNNPGIGFLMKRARRDYRSPKLFRRREIRRKHKSRKCIDSSLK